jgi:BolA protein
MNAGRVASIEARLIEAFAPTELEVTDESHLHVGHAGAKDGRGHFRVRIVSERFASASSIQRHRMVFDALGSLMQTDIHALSIAAEVPTKTH